MRQRTLDRLTLVLAIVAFGLALRYVVWRWRRVIHTSYWVRWVARVFFVFFDWMGGWVGGWVRGHTKRARKWIETGIGLARQAPPHAAALALPSLEVVAATT